MNNNKSLYSKYRPQTFDDIIGQDHITKTLKNQIETNKIHHAYLFSGPHGTGKTTTARVFAAALNTQPEDIYEIDAASNRKIEDIRNIREHINSLPLKSKYKIYIIDETHMLTKEASNALLKTLEEPPEFVIFILATTEKHKILNTIISRCQTFDFKYPTHQDILTALKTITQRENIDIQDDALNHIIQQSSASFRDAISNLEKVVTSTSVNPITLEHTQSVLGLNTELISIDILNHIALSQYDLAIETLRNAHKNNINPQYLSKNILDTTRQILLARFSPKQLETTPIPEHLKTTIKDLSTKKGANINSSLLSKLIDTHNKIILNPDYIYLEALLIELAENSTLK